VRDRLARRENLHRDLGGTAGGGSIAKQMLVAFGSLSESDGAGEGSKEASGESIRGGKGLLAEKV